MNLDNDVRCEIRRGLGDTRILKFLRELQRVNAEQKGCSTIDERINARAYVQACLTDYADENGNVNVEVWSRDCDMAESTYLETIPATFEALDKLRMKLAENAEGPFATRILSQEEAAEFQPHFRDRVLEAFENGSNYLV